MKTAQSGLARNACSYLIIGKGQLAKHLKHYFSLLNLSYTSWDRSQDLKQLRPLLELADRVLLAISDQALQPFFESELKARISKDCLVVHFSGALEIDEIFGAHPLMSFAGPLAELSFYQNISFIITRGNFETLLPDLKNPCFKISSQDKAYYHSLCVLGGNLPFYLWERTLNGMRELGLPRSAVINYIQQTCLNFCQHEVPTVSGPLARKDYGTIEKNISSLEGDPFQKIYQSFVNCLGDTP